MNNTECLAIKAERFAKAAHDSINHRRKYTDEPYWVHPERVAHLVSQHTKDGPTIAAAWMHDVLEDVAPENSEYDEAAIKREFGEKTLALVLEVTDVSKPEDGNRATRKALDRVHLANASDAGKLIKLADMIDNVIDIDKNDPHFAIVFRREVRKDLENLRSGSEVLFQQLIQILEEG